MGANWHRLEPKFWVDPKIRSWDDVTTLLALYILLGPQRITEGLFRLPPALVASDLGWTVEAVQERLQRLVADGFVAFDPEAEVVLIRKALKYQEPRGWKSVRGALHAINSVPPSKLFGDLLAAADEYAPDLAEGLREKYPRGSERASGSPFPPTPTPTPTPSSDRE